MRERRTLGLLLLLLLLLWKERQKEKKEEWEEERDRRRLASGIRSVYTTEELLQAAKQCELTRRCRAVDVDVHDVGVHMHVSGLVRPALGCTYNTAMPSLDHGPEQTVER